MQKNNLVIRFISAVSFLIVSKLYPYLTPENRERIASLSQRDESLPLNRASSEPDQDLNDDKEEIEKIKGLILGFGDEFDGIKAKVSAINVGAIESLEKAAEIHTHLVQLMMAMNDIVADNIDSKELSSASQASIKNLAQEVDSIRYFPIGEEELVMPNLSKRCQDDSMGDQDLSNFRALAKVKLEKLKTTKAEKLIYDDLAPWLTRVVEIDTDLLFNHYLNFLYEIRSSETEPNSELDTFIELLQDQRLRKQYATGKSQEIIERVQLYLLEKEKDITINDERTAVKALRDCLQDSTDDTQWTSEHADSLLTINDLKISNAYTSGGADYEPIFFNAPIESEFAGRPEFWKSEAVSVKNHIEGQLENYGYAQFTTRISGNHFVGGAIRVHGGGNDLIIFDTLDTTGESALKIKAYLESQQIHIGSVFSQYKLCGKCIQQDENNCGPFSLKIMQGLTPEACDAIIEGRQQANDFIRGLPIIKETMRDSDRWTADMGQEAGVRARIDVYDSLIDEMRTRNSTAISLINTIARERGIESPLKLGEDHSPSP